MQYQLRLRGEATLWKGTSSILVYTYSRRPRAGAGECLSLCWRERNLLCPCTSAHLLRCRCLRYGRGNANNIDAITVDLPSANTPFTPRSPTTTHRSYVPERHNYAVRIPFFCKYHVICDGSAKLKRPNLVLPLPPAPPRTRRTLKWPSWCPAEPPGRVEAGGRLLVRSTGENTAAAKLNWGELVAILFFKYLDRS